MEILDVIYKIMLCCPGERESRPGAGAECGGAPGRRQGIARTGARGLRRRPGRRDAVRLRQQLRLPGASSHLPQSSGRPLSSLLAMIRSAKAVIQKRKGCGR